MTTAEDSLYSTLPSCPPYHPNSELQGREGYYPNVSPAQLKCVSNLAMRIRDSNLDISDEYEHEFLKLLRFCRARQFDVEKAFQMIQKNVEWRMRNADLRHLTAQEVLQCADLRTFYRYFPSWVSGVDKQLRPIAWRKLGRLEIWQLTKLTSMENIIRFHAWEGEQSIRMMRATSLSSGYNIETFVIIIDAAHWHLGLCTKEALTFIQGMASTDSDHYPERLGALVVINAPSVLSIAYRVIAALLDDVQRKKIQILTHKNDWFPVLLELMDEDQIPLQYGGTYPDPDPECAFDSMNPPRSKDSVASEGSALDSRAVTIDARQSSTTSSLNRPPQLDVKEPADEKSSSTRRESWLEVAFDWLLRSDSISFPADFEDSQPMEEHKTVSSGPYSSSKVATCEVSTQTVAIDELIAEIKTTEGRRVSGMSRFGGYSEETKKESDHSTKEMNVTTPAMTASTENKFRTPLRTGSPIDFIDTRGEEDLPSTSTVVSSTKGCSCIIS